MDFSIIGKQCPEITALGVINIDSQEFRKLKNSLLSVYNPKNLVSYSEYIKRSIKLRIHPEKFFSRAKSFVFIALPFHILPIKDDFLPIANSTAPYGLIAGYATRFDYHLIVNPSKKFVACYPEIANSYPFTLPNTIKKIFREMIGDDIEMEFFSDTKPIAERMFAYYAGLGTIGRNHSLLSLSEGAGCFILGAAVNKQLPFIGINTVSHGKRICKNCLQCLKSCPSHAISYNTDEFDCKKCISWLTMEKKDELQLHERKMLRHWIWGCDRCTAVCPNTKLPSPLKVDLIKLLNISNNQLKKLIEFTPISYGGPKILKRNALYVLQNSVLRSPDTQK